MFESEEKENGESTGEKNGEGSGVAIRLADGIFKEGGTREGRGRGEGSLGRFYGILEDVNSLDPNVSPQTCGQGARWCNYIIRVYPIPAFPGRRMKENQRESRYKGMEPGHMTSGLREDEDRVGGERCRRAPPPKAERTSF